MWPVWLSAAVVSRSQTCCLTFPSNLPIALSTHTDTACRSDCCLFSFIFLIFCLVTVDEASPRSRSLDPVLVAAGAAALVLLQCPWQISKVGKCGGVCDLSSTYLTEHYKHPSIARRSQQGVLFWLFFLDACWLRVCGCASWRGATR